MTDLKFALRQILRNPGFTAVATLTLALGIGANTSIFSVINAFLFKPIQAREPQNLVSIFQQEVENPRNYRRNSYLDYVDIRKDKDIFEDVFIFGLTSVAIQNQGLTREVRADVISSSYFSTLGVMPLLGRGFLPEEETSPAPVAVLSHSYWKELGRDQAILGKSLKLSHGEATVVGVMPEGFTGSMIEGPALYLPLGMAETYYKDSSRIPQPVRTSRNIRQFAMIGRLKDNFNTKKLRSIEAIASDRFTASAPVENRGWRLAFYPPSRFVFSNGPDRVASKMAPVAFLASGLSMIVLVVACLNLANLMLTRGTARRKEIAVRLALGGSKTQIVRQLLTEGFLLALVGSTAGLLLSTWGTTVLTTVFNSSSGGAMIPVNVRPDIRVLGASLLLCALATLLFALGPALKLVKIDIAPDLKQHQGEDNGVNQRSLFGLRNVLAVGQIAFSLTLLVIASLFVRSALNVMTTDPGFELNQHFFAQIKPSLSGYDEIRSRSLIREAVDQVKALPGVESASFGAFIPLVGNSRDRVEIHPEGDRRTTSAPMPGADTKSIHATYNIIGENYFRTMGSPLHRGREFQSHEVHQKSATPVAIITAIVAERFWPGEDPIGKRIQFAGSSSQSMEVVGIAPAMDWTLFEKEQAPCIYVPFGQDYRETINLHVRIAAGLSPESMMSQVRAELNELDPQLSITTLRTMRSAHEQGPSVLVPRLGAILFALFASAALLLSVIGVFGLRAYAVARRTREIGIRMALGAGASSVMRLVLREGIYLALTGLGLGLLFSILAAQTVGRFLHRVEGLDPLAFSAAALLLIAALFLACIIPARRAARISPMAALREE